jgi:hypothetical protein
VGFGASAGIPSEPSAPEPQERPQRVLAMAQLRAVRASLIASLEQVEAAMLVMQITFEDEGDTEETGEAGSPQTFGHSARS